MISIYKKTGEIALMVDTAQYTRGGWLVLVNVDLSDCDLSPLANIYVCLDGCNLDGADMSQLDLRYVSFSRDRWSSSNSLNTLLLESLTPTQVAQSINADLLFDKIRGMYAEVI